MTATRIVGVDLGGTNLKVALFDMRYRIQEKRILNTASLLSCRQKGKRGSPRGSLIAAVEEQVCAIIDGNSLSKSDIAGVGLGLPGPVDYEAGIVHFFPNIAGWREVRLRQILKKRLGLKVYLDNDAKLMALAEYRLGAGRGFKNIVCVTLGTGVGGGIIIDGKLYRGRDNASAEIGHIPLNEDGPACNCGGIACLESYIGNNRIAQEVKRVFRRSLSLEEVSRLASNADRRAQAIWLRVGKQLGLGLATVVNILNPECIVIGGGVAGAGRTLFDAVRRTISNRAMTVQSKGLKVVRAALGGDAGLIGAAVMVREG